MDVKEGGFEGHPRPYTFFVKKCKRGFLHFWERFTNPFIFNEEKMYGHPRPYTFFVPPSYIFSEFL